MANSELESTIRCRPSIRSLNKTDGDKFLLLLSATVQTYVADLAQRIAIVIEDMNDMAANVDKLLLYDTGCRTPHSV